MAERKGGGTTGGRRNRERPHGALSGPARGGQIGVTTKCERECARDDEQTGEGHG